MLDKCSTSYAIAIYKLKPLDRVKGVCVCDYLYSGITWQ